MHFWKHDVLTSPLLKGLDSEVVMSIANEIVSTGQKRLSLWYHSGEPVWMAAESLAFMAKGRALHLRAERDGVLPGSVL